MLKTAETAPTITASEAKLHFGEILHRCVYERTPVTISKHNRPMAVLVSYEQWETDEEARKPHPLIQKIEAMQRAYQKKKRKKPHGGTTSVVSLLRELRDEREKSL
ncbi:MAG: hypothetical protein A3I75_05170 [Deltaproteobacteria bacterium RIFCSPLOWO2_02_FULL_50_16]|nr:MAG: hypothetical protein A3B79_03855 [Deltaproteobacteria bacterium RIFCSPHIGHO2_02_FULL_50_15]OGQ57545.1 MAG: hypothetical protein A3I75_05170 [Deltaproteobacteria bacterium RIFCSPLOWO2_02_FULL_50_16]OGQ67621.1 MAG: hypothetical protein A3F89_07195 [Deltaproteobacteria bacterium RIFCSPLOWO2_12_FULL_50_11]